MKNSLPFLYLCFFGLSTSFPALAHVPIGESGAWLGENAHEEHVFDGNLATALVEFFKKEKAETIVDFGCGLGSYAAAFREASIQIDCFDGNPSTPQLTDGHCGVLDLSVPHDLQKRYDWVMSLEVGEHLPKQFERIFIENLIRHSENGIVLSWARKGQGGYGHFNEQNNEYVKEVMASYGFQNDVEAENALRQKSSLWWFNSTIMVFRKG